MSTSSLPKRSPADSPANSLHKPSQGTSIDALIGYLVASKRSLSSIHLVQNATTLLSDARSALESTTFLAARTTFLRRSLTSQSKILKGVHFELDNGVHNVALDFESVLEELDKADKKLQTNIDILKATQVEDGFRAAAPGSGSEEVLQEDWKRTLYDFVDVKPVEELEDELKTAIDNVRQGQQQMDETVDAFQQDLQQVNRALSDNPPSVTRIGSANTQQDLGDILRQLEDHAREMAESLESLVKHFDLCVTAIKHTEGGGAAVAQKLETDDLPEGVGVEDFEAPAHSMNEEERLEMMAVLENDAAEVDDVVNEIRDRHAEMEALLDQIMLWKENKEHSYDDVATAIRLLEKIGTSLPSQISESSKLAFKWSEERVKIEDGMAGIHDLCEVYDNFLHAYDGLIVEVARRKAVKRQMERVVNEAQLKLDKLYEEDQIQRETFRMEQGDFLPSDIWHGLSFLPPKFTFAKVNEDDGSVPDLPRKTVEDALRRLKAEASRRPPD